MDIYLVGGAVRDELLGRPVTERDWVVLGATPQQMKNLGYRQVGRDFPVFLHPESQEEHALARTERKSAPGHTGFICHFGPEVTLEDDLRRRDLTINAMARTADGTLVDPYGGADDVQARLLRHVSDAFREDPLRVLRLARFAAQLPDFHVAADTLSLIRSMARANSLAELSAERVWQEVHKALDGAAPRRFFQVLEEAGALSPWFAELSGVEVEIPVSLAGAHERFAALGWIVDRDQITALSRRLRAPNRYQRLATHIAAHGRCLAAWTRAPASDVLTALTAIGLFATGQDPDAALRVVEACAEIKLASLRGLMPRLRDISAARFEAQALQGPALGDAIRAARTGLLRETQRA